MPSHISLCRWLCFAAMCLSARLVTAQATDTDRLAEAAEAAATIRETHFFTAGRGMHVVPGIYRIYDWMQRPDVPVDLTIGMPSLLGLNMEGRHAVGLFGVDYEGSRVGVLGCVACHSGRAAGVTYVGLGNKNIDVGMVGKVALAASQPSFLLRNVQAERDRPLIDRSMQLATQLADDRHNNLTQGMVPVALVWRWFFDQGDVSLPADFSRGAVKTPHLWGYGEKRMVGLFCDASGDGDLPGWAAAVELTAGQTPQNVRAYAGQLEDVERHFEKLLPPKYPFEIDRDLAARGKTVFSQTCRSCHGEYQRDKHGLPIFESPEFVSWADVGTDDDRLKPVSPQFRQLVAANPLNDLIRQTNHPPGYVAPRLDGIWARFPYLHNTSVPNLAALLTAANDRPKFWSLREAGEKHRFDPKTVGLTLPKPGSFEAARLKDRAALGDRAVFDTSRVGHSNQGHEFGVTLSADEKTALIEFLKTL